MARGTCRFDAVFAKSLWLRLQISAAMAHKMAGLLVFDDRDFSHHHQQGGRGHKRCSSHPPRAIVDMSRDGTGPLSPTFPASGHCLPQVGFIIDRRTLSSDISHAGFDSVLPVTSFLQFVNFCFVFFGICKLICDAKTVTEKFYWKPDQFS